MRISGLIISTAGIAIALISHNWLAAGGFVMAFSIILGSKE